MKKLIKLIIIVTIPFSLSSCFLKEKDITQMIFPISMLISYKDNNYYIHLLTLSNSFLSKVELESSQDFNKYSVSIFKGETIAKASENASIITNSNLSVIKIRSLILHKSLFELADFDYEKITTYILNNPLYKTNLIIYYTNDDPSNIYNINSISTSSNSEFYLTKPETKHLNDYLKPTKLLDTTKSYIDKKRMFYILSITNTNIHLKQDKDGKLNEVNTLIIEGALFLTKEGKFKYVELKDLKGLMYKLENEYIDINVDKNMSIKIENTRWNTFIKDNKIYVELNIKIKLDNTNLHYSFNELKNNIKEIIEKDILNTYDKLNNEIDIYHFNDLAKRKNQQINEGFLLKITIN